MTKYTYYVLQETGEKFSSPPSDIITNYDTYCQLDADSGKVLQHIYSGAKARHLVILAGYTELWKEVEDK